MAASFDVADIGLQQRRHALQESCWRSEERDLERRVTLLEQLLRKVSGVDRTVSAAAPEQARGDIFASQFQGPFLSRGQPLEEGLYINLQQPASVASRTAQTTSKASNPITEFFAGNHSSLSNHFGM
eukprot:TRINITY_DN27925_c0_g1_i1.p1 TRINITY_DN27925_c0_g1~~TRINITY_DN27925_c0_g1_i1.p1  ORF type:complete len:127 (-),score=26.82 TRINITY_DN27925_c0_g1_i1:76-456(-)